MKGVKIAFFDINLTNKTIDQSISDKDEIARLNTPVFNDLATAINQYIHKDNGPYALIFWTRNSIVIEAFVEFMQDEKRGFASTASPIAINHIDKDEFLKLDSEKISEKVVEILNQESIRFLTDFHNTVASSATSATDKIFNIIPKDTAWGENTTFEENLSKVLSKIAMSTLGFDYSKENPSRAINEGLIPLLNNEIINFPSNFDWKTILKPLIEAKKIGDVKSPDDTVQQKVNTIFHLEPTNNDKEIRGVVVEIDSTNKTVLGSLNIDSYQEWRDKLLAVKTNKSDLLKKIQDESKLVAIEISAACDFSNKKKRINKYILGLISPPIDVKKDVNFRKESSYHSGGCSFELEGKPIQIWLDLNFVFGCPKEDKRLGEPLFILKKEIMDMIGNKYASHVSRIGITSF